MLHVSINGYHGSRRFLCSLLVPVLAVLSACGGSSDSSEPDSETPPPSSDVDGDISASYLVSGTVSGMADQGLVLVLNDDETREVGGVSFSFDTEVASGAEYKVLIADSPEGHQCSVQNGTGTVADSPPGWFLCRISFSA